MSRFLPRSSPRRSAFRAVKIETLEPRHLLAVDWRNPVDAIDINSDREITAFDALEVINELNRHGARALSSPKPANLPFWDATGDNRITAFDALAVINHLNRANAGVYSLAEQADRLAIEQAITITAGELAEGARRYQLKVEPQFDTSDSQAASEDILNVYLFDPATGQTIVDAGSPNSSLFSLAGSQPLVKNGLVQWDGSLLSIDLSDFSETLELRLQLLNVDADHGSRVLITPWSNSVDPLGTPDSPGELRPKPAQLGPAIELAAYFQIPGLTVEMENSSYQMSTGRFTAEVRLVNNAAATVSNGVLHLPGFGAGVTAVNASGVAEGVPYWNFAAAVGPGAMTDWKQVILDLPANQALLWRPEVLGYSGCDQLAEFGVFCGTITETEEQHIFNMPLEYGDELLILPMKVPGTTTTSSPQTRMIRPDFGPDPGHMFPTSLRATFDTFETSRTGNYQFELTGKATGEFSVAFHKKAHLEELVIGSERSGFFDPRLGPQVYAFNGTAGQTIFIENRLPASETRFGNWKLFTADDNQEYAWFDNTGGDQEFRITQTGTFYLIFSPPDYTSTPTAFDFLLRTPIETHHTTMSGTTNHVTFESAGHRHVYSFEATAGQQVIFDSLREYRPADLTQIAIVNPWGVRVTFTEAKSELLDVTGKWQLIVRGNQAGSTFSFKLHNLAELPLIASGVEISGTVGQYEADYYRLPAATGDLLQLQRTGGDPVHISVTGPSTQYVAQFNSATPFELLATGDFVVKVQVLAGETADRNYSLIPTRIPADSGANFGLDADYAGEINSGIAILATFTATAGTQILIDEQFPAGSTHSKQLQVIGAVNTLVAGNPDVITILKSGTFTIRAWNQSSAAEPYAFRIINLATVPLLTDGGTIDEVLTHGRMAVRRVAAQSDDLLLLDARGSSNFAGAKVKLISAATETHPFETRTGYRLIDVPISETQYLVFEQTGTSEATVSVQARFKNAAPELLFDTPITGTLGPTNSSQLFKFRVQAGQTLYLDSLALSTPGAIKVYSETLTTTRAANWHFDEAGEHHLYLSSDAATPVTFTIRANFAPTATLPLVFDALTTGTLLAGERHVYSFTGKKNQLLFIDGLDENSPAAQMTFWRNDLSFPDSERTTASNYAYWLESDGEYRIVVGELVGTYEFRVMDVDNLPLLPLNTQFQGSIAADEQARLWRFPADHDQIIEVDSNANLAMPFAGTMTMIDPQGSPVATTNLQTDNDLSRQFVRAGNNILVMNAAAVPFNYDVRVRTSEKTVLATNLGAIVSGVLQERSDVVEYSFSAVAGQHIQIATLTSALTILIDPDGNQLVNREGHSYLLKTSGEYRFRLSVGLQYNAPYRFQIVDVATLPLLPLNTQISGSTTTSDWLLYRLPAVAGQRYEFDYQSQSGATNYNTWALAGPEGSTLFSTSFYGGDQNLTIPESGNHLLYLRFPSGSVNYAFQVNELIQPAVVVAGLDQTYSDSVMLEERKNIEFTGYAGQRVLLDVLGRNELQTVTRIYAPDGSFLDFFATEDELYTLPLSGAYRLEFYANGSATPVNYSVRLTDASNLPSLQHNTWFAINFDQTYQGEIWAFDATAGDLLGFDVGVLDMNASFRVVEPDGKSFSLSELVQMNKTGRHYLVMNGRHQPSPVFSEGKIWNPNLLQATTEGPFEVHFAGQEWHYYSFELVAGQRVFFTLLTTSPTYTYWHFTGPRFQSLEVSLDDTARPDVFTATRNGRYTLLVYRNVTSPATFTYQIHTAAIRQTYGLARDHAQ